MFHFSGEISLFFKTKLCLVKKLIIRTVHFLLHFFFTKYLHNFHEILLLFHKVFSACKQIQIKLELLLSPEISSTLENKK